MPVMTGKDSQGCYAKWGDQGKKYYYECNNAEARKRAKAKAERQGRAARASGYGNVEKGFWKGMFVDERLFPYLEDDYEDQLGR